MPNGAAALKALKKAQDVTYVAPSAWPPGILEHSEHRRGMLGAGISIAVAIVAVAAYRGRGHFFVGGPPR
jgi:hypothetical protein